MTAAQRGRRNRNHGHETERMVVRWLRDNGFPDAATTRSRLGHDGFRQPGDVEFSPGIVLEVKGFMDGGSRWPSWRAQCVAEAGGRIPVVLRRTRGVPDVAQWQCELPMAELWALIELDEPLPAGPRVAMHCPRTEQIWTRLPFGELVELVAEQ